MIIKDKKINFSKQLSKYLQKHDLTGREFAAFVGIDEAQVIIQHQAGGTRQGIADMSAQGLFDR